VATRAATLRFGNLRETLHDLAACQATIFLVGVELDALARNRNGRS
jgi:hypothetical protein